MYHTSLFGDNMSRIEHNGFIFEDTDSELLLRFKKSNIAFAFLNKEDHLDIETGKKKYKISDEANFFKSFMSKFLHKTQDNYEYEDLLVFCDNVFDEMVEGWADGIGDADD